MNSKGLSDVRHVHLFCATDWRVSDFLVLIQAPILSTKTQKKAGNKIVTSLRDLAD